ncbi:MAG: IS66 family insertion sequence element accessory protein TnpB [Bacillus sp. (in: firmicutes)]
MANHQLRKKWEGRIEDFTSSGQSGAAIIEVNTWVRFGTATKCYPDPPGFMLNVDSVDRVYLARGSTDLRKSIDGLAILVKEGFDLDPFSSSLFVFCNRKRDKLKILHWDHNGFWLYYRRLERGTFHWPSEGNSSFIH